MANVFDVANYILEKKGATSVMKLQKLVYYSQAWSLTWNEQPLFEEDIQAWVNGPVVRGLYNAHRGNYKVEPNFFNGNSESLNKYQMETIDKVLAFYGDKDPQWLSELTHMESPWIEARKALNNLERGEVVISKESMLEYYSSL